VNNIPFIAKRISLGDTIKAEYDVDDSAYYFDDFVAVSGNSTIRIYYENENIVPETRNLLKRLGCDSEAFLSRNIIAVNVPKKTDYRPIKKYLDEGEKNRMWTYEESCLSHPY
jgi:hypothetical protein